MVRDRRRALRVLAVDDSAVMRGVLRTVFELHASQGDGTLPRMELCGLMRDGVEALEGVRDLSPDVLLLDLEMPRMDGLELLEKLRTVAPAMPVIMCSAYTERGARSTLDALSLGAKDYVMKPGQQKDFAAALDTLMEQLLPKIAALAGSVSPSAAPEKQSQRPEATLAERAADLGSPERPVRRLASPLNLESLSRVEIVVIGVSTGGPSALELMLPSLPKNFPVPLLIVQHMPRLFTGALAERLDQMCKLTVQQARDGARISPGEVWLAPGDAHMEVQWSAGRQGVMVKLHQGPPLNSCKPSVDYLFQSAAKVYGAGVLALVMTGMGSDGLEGAKAVRSAGGTVLAQDEATSAVWGMPGRVAKDGLAAALVPLGSLAGVLIHKVMEGRLDGREERLEPWPLRREVAYGVL